MPYCAECGNQVQDSSKFCPACGQRIEDSVRIKKSVSKSNRKTESLIQGATEKDLDRVHLTSEVNPNTGNFFTRRQIFLFVFLPLIILIIFFGVFDGFSSSSESSSETSNSIEEKTDSTSKNKNTKSQKSDNLTGTIGWYLNQPAQQYVAPGQGLIALNQNLGISLNNGSRPITVKELADQIYEATSSMAGEKLTKNQVHIGLQPGGGLYNFLAALLNGPESYQAIVFELLQMGSHNE